MVRRCSSLTRVLKRSLASKTWLPLTYRTLLLTLSLTVPIAVPPLQYPNYSTPLTVPLITVPPYSTPITVPSLQYPSQFGRIRSRLSSSLFALFRGAPLARASRLAAARLPR